MVVICASESLKFRKETISKYNSFHLFHRFVYLTFNLDNGQTVAFDIEVYLPSKVFIQPD